MNRNGLSPRLTGVGVLSDVYDPGHGLVLAVMAAAAIIAAAALAPVPTLLVEGPTLCPVRLSTGLLCPGCGSTRALAGLLHGDVLHALGANPLAVLLSPVVLFALIKQGARTLGAEVDRTMVHSRYIWALLAVVLVYTVLRNLPWEPFTLLAP